MPHMGTDLMAVRMVTGHARVQERPWVGKLVVMVGSNVLLCHPGKALCGVQQEAGGDAMAATYDNRKLLVPAACDTEPHFHGPHGMRLDALPSFQAPVSTPGMVRAVLLHPGQKRRWSRVLQL